GIVVDGSTFQTQRVHSGAVKSMPVPMSTPTLNSKHQCNVCLKCFKSNAHLTSHMRSHTGERPYACEVCPKRFNYKSNLYDHMKTHTGEKPYSCDICTQKFATSSNLKKHKRTHTGERPYACDICPLKFISSSNLKIHKRTHTGEKPYSCDICPMKFATRYRLITHMRTHTGEKPYSCDICPLKFATSSNLKKHKRSHTGEKPYACEVCPLKFATNSNLYEHMRTHTREKPYSCDICPLKFSAHYRLIIHMRTHTGERPYACDICPLKFATSSTLIIHKRTHTGEKPYSCDICPMKFATNSHLKKHERTHIDDNQSEQNENLQPSSSSRINFACDIKHISGYIDCDDIDQSLLEKIDLEKDSGALRALSWSFKQVYSHGIKALNKYNVSPCKRPESILEYGIPKTYVLSVNKSLDELKHVGGTKTDMPQRLIDRLSEWRQRAEDCSYTEHQMYELLKANQPKNLTAKVMPFECAARLGKEKKKAIVETLEHCVFEFSFAYIPELLQNYQKQNKIAFTEIPNIIDRLCAGFVILAQFHARNENSNTTHVTTRQHWIHNHPSN
ncbi:oocyte zinc finger protein XlCOF22-like, partial [Sitodiplosis mosellana]|uniref:oocyte zinc finger protein XlCOF22-like n=1 Tax=Sitodiplosis mosellana TaxID=263140 RepID=UPI002444D38E